MENKEFTLYIQTTAILTFREYDDKSFGLGAFSDQAICQDPQRTLSARNADGKLIMNLHNPRANGILVYQVLKYHIHPPPIFRWLTDTSPIQTHGSMPVFRSTQCWDSWDTLRLCRRQKRHFESCQRKRPYSFTMQFDNARFFLTWLS